MTRFNSRWHEILFKFPKFSRFFSNFRGFSWISAVVTSGVLKTGSNLTPLDAIHTETEHNQYKYLWIPHFSLSFSLSTMWKRRGSDRERAVLHNTSDLDQLVEPSLMYETWFDLTRPHLQGCPAIVVLWNFHRNLLPGLHLNKVLLQWVRRDYVKNIRGISVTLCVVASL